MAIKSTLFPRFDLTIATFRLGDYSSQLIDPSGSQGEQVQHTNFAQQGDMSSVYKLRGGYSENWTVFWITAHFLNAAARFREMGDAGPQFNPSGR